MDTVKKSILGIVLFASAVSTYAQEDMIVYRNGTEKKVRLLVVSTDKVTYQESTKGGPEFQDVLRDIYMLKYGKRGNVYISEEGKRISGEFQKIGKGVNVIYLVSGKEILADKLQIAEDKVKYTEKKDDAKVFGKKKMTTDDIKEIDLKDVFLIKYSDGTKDLVNDISAEALEKAKKEAEELARREAEQREAKQETKQVVFHKVKRGETLGTIAKRYQVSTSELLEWNDLPGSFKNTTRLKPDMQLMIYVQVNSN